MSLSRSIDLTFFINSSFEIPIYLAIRNAKIEIFSITPQSSLAKDAVNYMTISIINKGNNGLGTEEIAKFTSNSADPEAIDFVGFIAHIKEIDYQVTKDDVIAFKVVENGICNLGLCSILLQERRN